jgi:hypothetical protein
MDIGSAQGTASMAASMQKDTFGAQLVTKTLDYMNQDQNSGTTNADYDFQTKVLSAAGIGGNLNINV